MESNSHWFNPLDRTIDAIGMGRYQWALLFLSGCGWAADNMWLQAVAIILPRVQDEWRVDDRWIGLVSSSTFAGMMVGAISWGTCESKRSVDSEAGKVQKGQLLTLLFILLHSRLGFVW